MIEFKVVVHKETGTIIKYDEWLRYVKGNEDINFSRITHKPYTEKTWGIYKAKDMLFSDDFEIVYESELSSEDILKIYNCLTDNETKIKIAEMINKRVKIGREILMED